MNDVTQPIQDGVAGVVDTVKSVGEDVVSVKFYKSPALYILLAYICLLVGARLTMGRSAVNSYIFEQNKTMGLMDLFTYPYGLKSPEAIIKTMLSNPYILYLFMFTILYPGFMEIKKTGTKPFMYGVAVSTFMVIFLFLIHVGVYKILVDPKKVELGEGFPGKKSGRTYAQLYRGHWISLFIFSPIYAFIVVYLARKLG